MDRVVANGIRIAYDVVGEGEPLVLVMGLASQMVSWPQPFVDMLVEHGFRVIRFDNRDIGESEWFADAGVPDVQKLVVRRVAGRKVRAPYTLSDMAGDIAGLLDALGIEDAHIAGVSMGGMIAQTFAIEHGRRTRSLTSIMSTTGSVRHLLPRPDALRAIFTPPPSSRLDDVVEHRVRFFERVGGDLPLDWDEVRRVTAWSYERGYNPSAAARQLAAVLASGSREPRLPNVLVPTSVIHGAQDPLVLPAAGQATARLVPNARYIELAGMGHCLPRAVWRPIADELARRAGPRSG